LVCSRVYTVWSHIVLLTNLQNADKMLSCNRETARFLLKFCHATAAQLYEKSHFELATGILSDVEDHRRSRESSERV